MTKKQYHKRLKKFTQLYLEMRAITRKMKEAGFAYPIGLNVGPYGNNEVHLSGDHGEILPDFDFSQIREFQTDHGWLEFSSIVDGVKFLYLIKQKEDNHVGNQT